MSRGVNKVILVGNLGKDPELRKSQTGTEITTLSVATSEYWTDKASGKKQERTEWHRVVLFGKLAGIADTYCKKGTKVYIEGSLRTRKWQDNSGKDNYTTEVIAAEMQMLDARGDIGESQNTNFNAASQPSPTMPNKETDDDIPF